MIMESMDRSPERRFKEKPQGAFAVNQDGGVEAIHMTVAKSKVWQGAQVDAHH